MVLVGLPPEPLEVEAFGIITGRRSLSGSNIGELLKRRRYVTFVLSKPLLPILN